MRMKKLLLIISASLSMVLGGIAIVIACGGSPQPPCPQGGWLGKFAGGVFVIPPGGGGFAVPLGMAPGVVWDNTTPQCAQPTGAAITLMAVCTPVFPPGPAFPIAAQVFPQPVPVVPGPQPPGGVVVPFAIPPGTPPSVCLVAGTYDVAFGGGIGNAALSFPGDLQICLVEPSPADPSGDTPRLDLEFLTPDIDVDEPGGGESGLYRFHAGDQQYVYLRISNNDLDRDAELKIISDGDQIAGFPVGFDNEDDAYGDNVFRLADPGDLFPTEFFFDDQPFNRLPGAPGDPVPPFNGDITLKPGEIQVFGIAINSFGACADGSCNDRNVCAEGELTREGEDPILVKACTQFAYLVDNSLPPTYPGLTFFDEIKVDDLVDTQWGPVNFQDPRGQFIDQTHRGNLIEDLMVPELQPGPATQLTGEGLRPPTGPFFPNHWFDQITLPSPVQLAHWQSFFFYEDVGFQRRGNETILTGLDQLQQDCQFPSITLNNPLDPNVNFARILADVRQGCNENTQVGVFELVNNQFQLVQQGTIQELDQDQNIRVDFNTCRTLRQPLGNNLNRLIMRADPPIIVENFDPEDETPLQRAIRILDQLDREVEWDARFEPIGEGGGVALLGTQGRGTSNIVIDPNVLDPLDPFDEILGFLVYTNDQAVNSPLRVPVAARRLPPPQLLPIDFEFNAPPLAQIGQTYDAGIFIPPIDPQPIDPYFNMEFFIGIETNDPIEIFIPDPFLIVPIDPDTPDPELERLKGKFGEDPINKCSEGVWKCGKIEFGDGFEFETEIFADGFESGDVSAWSTGAAADNSQKKTKQQPVGVLDEDKKLPVFTEEELRKAIELFNDDVAFDEKTIGLDNDRFNINVPLPPIRGTYFFDEFESFRKGASSHPVIDGSRCPPPCSGLVIEADGGGVSNIRFQNFPNHGIEIKCDSLWIASNEFAGNGAGGLLINGNNNFVADSLVRANRFEENGGAGITVERGTGNRLLFNVFTHIDTLWFPIDLAADGITPNDDGDRDTGPNDLQNFPVLTRVLRGGSTTIEGTLNSTPDADFRLQFFAWNDSLTRFLGETTVRTDGNGDARIDVVVDGTAEIGQEVFATATDAAGNTSEFSAGVRVDTGVATEGPEAVPATFRLDQNYPNPFNPETVIPYEVPRAGRVQLEVYDVLGRLVAVLVDGVQAAGRYEALFRAGELPSGTYLYQLRGDGFVQVRKLMLLK